MLTMCPAVQGSFYAEPVTGSSVRLRSSREATFRLLRGAVVPEANEDRATREGIE